MIDPKEKETLYADFLANALDEAGMRRLEAVLREDPAAREDLAALQDIDVLGEMLGRTPKDCEEFADRVMVSLSDDEQRHRLTEAVLQDVREEEYSTGTRAIRRHRAISSRQHPFPAWAAAAAMIVVAVGLFAFLSRKEVAQAREMVAILKETTSGVVVHRRGAPLVARSGMELYAGDAIEVGGTGSTAIVYQDSTRLELSGGTTLRDGGGRKIFLDRGILVAAVRARSEQDPLVVQTLHAEAKILGTRFTLQVTTDATRLQVADGKVLCRRIHDGTAVEVGPDHYAIMAQGVPLEALPVVPDDVLTRLPAGSKVLFWQDFQKSAIGPWIGERRSPPAVASGEEALQSVPFERVEKSIFAYATSPVQESGWPAGNHTYLQFRYFVEGFTDHQGLKLMVKRRDLTNYIGFLDAPTLGRWETVTVAIGDFVSALGQPTHPVTGSTFHHLAWYGYCYKSPPPPSARFWIDDVILFESPAPVPSQRLTETPGK